MRAIADKLGIKAASLYNHFKDKQSLYDAIAERICNNTKPSCGLVDPKRYLIEQAELFRRELLKVQDSVKIITASPPLTPTRIELVKNDLLCFINLGVKKENCIIAARLFYNYILSFVSDETTMVSERWDDANPFITVFGEDYKPLSNDEQFMRGLETLFAGYKILE
ncbi:TetR/AcrR family transcriptional regulator [Alkaliphilus transvaalensis]|uniref:TetR/AcrR family transcriptional regulator n=1 Tax=Alkaliphilus transvaalensis TaxID=114628 RepID=UPI00047A61B9|nr:TetR family transcriptional regulator [Alkaliphilus transvaalensis]